MREKKSKIIILVAVLLLAVIGLFRFAYGIGFSNYIAKRYGEILNTNESYKAENINLGRGNLKKFKCEENGINFICYSPLKISGKYGNLQMYYDDSDNIEKSFDMLVGFNCFDYFLGKKDNDFSLTLYYLDESAQRRQVSFKLDGDKNIRNSEDLSNVELELFESMKPRINEIYDLLYEKWPELKK